MDVAGQVSEFVTILANGPASLIGKHRQGVLFDSPQNREQDIDPEIDATAGNEEDTEWGNYGSGYVSGTFHMISI